jgi:hypothetical protein
MTSPQTPAHRPGGCISSKGWLRAAARRIIEEWRTEKRRAPAACEPTRPDPERSCSSVQVGHKEHRSTKKRRLIEATSQKHRGGTPKARSGQARGATTTFVQRDIGPESTSRETNSWAPA